MPFPPGVSASVSARADRQHDVHRGFQEDSNRDVTEEAYDTATTLPRLAIAL